MYANVVVNITHEKLDKGFTYRVPRELEDALEPGAVVTVPFGRGNRLIQGYVTGLSGQCAYGEDKIKDIREVVTDGLGVETRLIGLAAWIRDRYGSTMIQALKTVIPVKQKVKMKESRRLVCLLEPQELQRQLEECRKKHQTARARLLEAFLERPVIPWERAQSELQATMATARAMEEKGYLRIEAQQEYRDPVAALLGLEGDGEPESAASPAAPVLNEEQRQAVHTIVSRWEQEPEGRYLIHGVTGSGKTEVYMELIAEALRRGEQAIVLIPEIALTYQTVLRFYRRFRGRVSMIHSRLSPGERYDQFERAKRGEIQVMIGPRSALFTPFPNLGIIIVDEEHEPSYQSEGAPCYHAREVALKRGAMEHARVVLGSATPSLEAYYGATRGMYQLIELKNRAAGGALPRVCLTDMRGELRAGNRSMLGGLLWEKIKERLNRREQVMLFLNRRGYAGFLSCRSCGHVLMCPHCDVSLTIHRDKKLHCHYCGYEEEYPGTCPECGSTFIRSFKVGTQQVESMIAREFPGARILRMDLDTTKGKKGHARILEAFAEGEGDILIGTQMIVKGHDFPRVTLMGVLAADLSLHGGDYRAAERTFQLLTQAAGRAGRGALPGEVVIQTYEPEHYAITSAVRQDYREFYEQEILYRKLAGYPPAGNMLEIRLGCPDEEQLGLGADYLKRFLAPAAEKYGAALLGPTAANISRVSDIYYKVIYLKHEQEKLLISLKNRAEQYIEINSGYDAITVQFTLN